MQPPIRLRSLAVVSLLVTYAFFIEYLPPFRRFHIPYDLEGFHYPLADYAFRALRQGRFPEWDPTMYCGLSFAGNVQAALFYPPNWLMFAANLGRHRLSYQGLQDLVFAHVWLAFLLCFLWLRRKSLADLAAILGAAIFAFSGYMMLQLQHFGLIAGYTWMPLALWGIDEAVEERRWRPLWKVLVASALCFLGGYPPTWFVFAVLMVSYAAWRWKVALGTVAALGASLVLAAVQLLPALENYALKMPEVRYGAGIREPAFYISYLVPNYFDFGPGVDPAKNPGREYLYLGAPAFFGLAWLLRRRRWHDVAPLLVMLAAAFILLTNPFGLVWAAVRHSSLLAQVCRDWYFLAGITLALAALAAFGLDHCLRQPRRPAARPLALLTIGLLAAWSLAELAAWIVLRSDFPSGWKSAFQPAVTLALFSAAMFILPAQQGALRLWLAAALLFTVAVDYKVFGTSKRVNAGPGAAALNYSRELFPGMDDKVYRRLRENSQYRVALDIPGPFPTELRRHELTTPQGFDPFLTAQYKRLMDRIARFVTDRQIALDPQNRDALHLLGVRYFITSEYGPLYPRLACDTAFQLLEPSRSYGKVFEFSEAEPPYRWVEQDGARSLRPIRWKPETRAFLARSSAGGRVALAEQFFPGWQATVDGAPVPIERWSEAFQSVRVPPGEHRVEFRFRSRGLRLGALISLAALLGLVSAGKCLAQAKPPAPQVTRP